MEDIRWIQRFNNFENAMKNLLTAVEEQTSRELNDLERQGVIQIFEYCYDLAWKTLKDFYEAHGETNIHGSRDAFTLAFERGLISENYGYTLLDSVKSRNSTSHTYNKETAEEIFDDIINKYYDAFNEIINKLNEEKNKTKI